MTTVRISKNAPPPRKKGIVRNSAEWRQAVRQIEAGKSIEIRLPAKMPGLQYPLFAFLHALRRKYGESYTIYARDNVIYAQPKATAKSA